MAYSLTSYTDRCTKYLKAEALIMPWLAHMWQAPRKFGARNASTLMFLIEEILSPASGSLYGPAMRVLQSPQLSCCSSVATLLFECVDE